MLPEKLKKDHRSLQQTESIVVQKEDRVQRIESSIDAAQKKLNNCNIQCNRERQVARRSRVACIVDGREKTDNSKLKGIEDLIAELESDLEFLEEELKSEGNHLAHSKKELQDSRKRFFIAVENYYMTHFEEAMVDFYQTAILPIASLRHIASTCGVNLEGNTWQGRSISVTRMGKELGWRIHTGDIAPVITSLNESQQWFKEQCDSPQGEGEETSN